MNEEIRGRIAALNVAWQRYVRTAEEQPDPAVTEALKRDYYAAWEGLDACGIAEWMLEYNPATLTFSLPTTAKMAARNRRDGDDPDTEQIPAI